MASCRRSWSVAAPAVELYSNSAMMTGDFDIVTACQAEFEEELKALGFFKPVGVGHTPLGWIHAGLKLGFEVVASSLFDGAVGRDRVVLVNLGEDGEIAIVSVEDMIADRMGQHASGAAPDMLEQARSLYALYADADLDYMEARIRHESAGDYGIADLRQ